MTRSGKVALLIPQSPEGWWDKHDLKPSVDTYRDELIDCLGHEIGLHSFPFTFAERYHSRRV